MKKIGLGWLFLISLFFLNTSVACETCEKVDVVSDKQEQHLSPDQLLETAVTHLITYLRANPKADKMMISAYLEQHVADYFDFAYMSKWILGRAYKDMDLFHKAKIEVKLKRLVLATLTQHLGKYSNQRFKFLPVRKASENEVRLTMLVENLGRFPNKIEFRFYRSTEGWKVFDITANRSSMLAYYRHLFKQQRKHIMNLAVESRK